ncbi:hypothetical protein BHE74_00040077 [Ensete ventricosum]|nr:hypothetical protein BHE74_00040077 [Ensete ventricosum]
MAEPEGRPMVAAAAAGRPGRQAPQQQQAGFGQSLAGIVRMAVFWYFAMKFFGPKKAAEPSQLMSNLFHKGEPLVRFKLKSTIRLTCWKSYSFLFCSAVVAFLPKSKSGKKKSLLGSSKDSEGEESIAELKDDTQVEAKDVGPVEWISYWKPNITVNLVDDFTRYFPTCSP